MSQFYGIDFSRAEGTTLGMEEHPKPTASMFYQVLPTIVQSRMPILPSVRRSLSDFSTRALHSKHNSLSEVSLPGTPPPDYTSRPGSGRTTPHQYTSLTSTSVSDLEDETSLTSLAQSTHHPPTVAHESSTGISWQHARHGVAGINEAYQQAMASPCGNDDVMTDIVRSQYLHSMALLLKSLPPALTPAEQLSIFAAIPQSVVGNGRQASGPVYQPETTRQEAASRSFLWQVTAWLVFNLFIVIEIMAPYVKQSLRHAAQWEHDHQIVRRALNTSIILGSGVSARVTQVISRLNNGVAGEVFTNAIVYCADGIAGGIQQGLAEASRSRKEGRITDSAIM